MKIYLTLSLLLLAVNLHAAEQEYRSGPQQVQLLELFTSEGCSSCPPADRWLNSLANSDGLWNKFVPLAFHVDYWDYIGWPDRFASRENSQRQRRYAAEFGEPTVYTPGVRKAGKEWRHWRQRASVRELVEADQSIAGTLYLKVDDDGWFKAEFASPESGSRLSQQLSLAILGRDLTTEVKRGENRGKKLRHDFVVLSQTTLTGRTAGGMTKWSGQLPKVKHAGVGKFSIAAWVTQGPSLVPLQALGGEIILRQ